MVFFCFYFSDGEDLNGCDFLVFVIIKCVDKGFLFGVNGKLYFIFGFF